MKVFAKDEWYISLSDFWTEIKKAKIKILLFAFLLAILFFAKALIRPTVYQSEGIFVSNSNNQGTNPLFQALQINTPNQLNDDVSTFLDSVEVMKLVVEKLNLQAYLLPKAKENLFQQIWKNLKTDGYYHYYKKLCRPYSNILTGDILVADQDLCQQIPNSLSCSQVIYNANIFSLLQIVFLDETTYQVFLKKDLLGEGKIGSTFEWKEGRFTLQSYQNSSLKGETFFLSLIPKEAVAKSLKKSIVLVKDTKKDNLTHIYFTHPDKVLAANVVNELMNAYQDFVLTLAEKKIKKQLDYLEKRKEETALLFEKTSLMAICHKMKKIFSINTSEELTTSDLLKFVRSFKEDFSLKEDLQSLTLEVASEQLERTQSGFISTEQKQKKYELCYQGLQQTDFDVVEMFCILKGTDAENHLAEIEKFNFQSNDKKAYTPKEIEFAKQQIETNKKYLLSFLPQLIKGCETEKKIYREKIERLKKICLLFLLDEFDQIASQDDLLEGKKLPFEKRILFEKEFCVDMLKLLQSEIESKNLSMHLQTLDSFPFEKASISILPFQPKLTRKFFIGFFGGVALYLFALFILTVCKGPSCSRANLKGAGFHFLDKVSNSDLSLKNLSFFLSHKERGTLLLSSESDFYPISGLLEILKAKNSSFLIIDFVSCSEDSFINCIDARIPPIKENCLVFGQVPYYKEQYLKSKKFQEALASFQNRYDWILLLNKAKPESFETQILTEFAETIIYLARHEKLACFAKLPKEKLCFLVEHKHKEKELNQVVSFLKRQKQKSIKAIEPNLSALMKEVQSSRPLTFLFSFWQGPRT